MGQISLQKTGFLSLLSFLLISIILSFISGNLSFISFGFIFALFAVFISKFIGRNTQKNFLNIVWIFFFIYSVFGVLSYFVVYENPLIDHLGDVDQTGYYGTAIYLASFSYSEIWSLAFTEFMYHEAPLFNAWIATVHKLSGLGTYYGALLQKLNVVFFASFIPAILYQMLEKVTDSKQAIKWGILFGLFSFFFYYSGILLRDIHLSLLFTWAFYLILKGEYSLKVYSLLIGIGIVVYYLRIENGLFFLGFFAIWFLYSKSKKKWLIGLLTVPLIAFSIIYLGGIESLMVRGIDTLETYGERGLRAASEDSFAATLSQLPIPLNWIGKFIFSQIYPFPFWAIFEEDLVKNIFHFPRAIGAFFWVFIWTHTLLNIRRITPLIKKYRWLLILALLYIFLVSQGQPYERRLIQVYPFLFIFFVFISKLRVKRSILYFCFGYAGMIGIYLILKSL